MRFVDRSKTVIEQILEAVSHMIDENGGYLSSDPGAIEIDINNVSDYFEGVRVHPLASDWYADLIKKYVDTIMLYF